MNDEMDVFGHTEDTVLFSRNELLILISGLLHVYHQKNVIGKFIWKPYEIGLMSLRSIIMQEDSVSGSEITATLETIENFLDIPE